MTPQSSLRVLGKLLEPGDPEYEEARKIHNGMIDRRPALIARCAGAEDVMACVRHAQRRNALISVRGGGHGVAGFAVCDGGVMIDLSSMRDVQVDPVRRTARVGGGATWGDVDRETQAVGLATTGGVARPTGVAGLTLGGGHGFLMRKYGLACDNLISAQVVTANGELLTASANENADLFWALRGGGGNFGIVTSLEFRLHEVSQILGGLLIYPIEHAREVFGAYREMTASAPDELGSLAVIGRLPDGTPVAVIMICYSGEPNTGERLIQPLRNCAPLIADQVALMPYAALQSIVENFNPRGLRNYWKSSFLTGIPEAAAQMMVDHFASVPSPLTHIVVEHLGGAVGRVPHEATAVAHRDAPYNMLIVGMWEEAAADERGMSWVRDLWSAMQPFSSGAVYVNYLGADGDEGASRVREAYTPTIDGRLLTVKRKFDPDNLFRLNHNIDPMRRD
jgi:UDP-N-acetylenolpyruvoylglucosamine reductase